jgi:hypothetical protein
MSPVAIATFTDNKMHKKSADRKRKIMLSAVSSASQISLFDTGV